MKRNTHEILNVCVGRKEYHDHENISGGVCVCVESFEKLHVVASFCFFWVGLFVIFYVIILICNNTSVAFTKPFTNTTNPPHPIPPTPPCPR